MRAAGAAIAVLLAACAHHSPPEHAKPLVQHDRSASAGRGDAGLADNALRLQSLLLEIQGGSGQLDVGAALVPEFELVAPSGPRYSSRDLIRKKPFVAVFFATWCDYCQGELRAMERAFRQVGPLPVIPVSADGPETWDSVPAYLASFGIREAPVRATDYRGFFSAYNPSDSLPSVTIVGRAGTLVDYIHGYDPAHDQRLLASLRQAKTAAPLTWPSLDASNVPLRQR